MGMIHSRESMGTFVVKVFDWTIAKTGLSENEANKNGFETETIIVPANDKTHYYPDSKRIIVKLIAEKSSGLLLGAEIIGDGVVDKRIDVVASALTGKATIEQLSKYDLSYAPPYSTPMDPVITAANVLRNKLEGETNSISSIETKEKLDRKDDFILLDVRTKPEYDRRTHRRLPSHTLERAPIKNGSVRQIKRDCHILRSGIEGFSCPPYSKKRGV